MIILVATYDKVRAMSRNKNDKFSLLSDPFPFKELTNQKNILFGETTQRKVGKPLPNRRTYVLTNKIKLNIRGVEAIYDFDKIIKKFYTNKNEDIYICGGISIYKKFLKYTEKLIIYHLPGARKNISKFPMWNISAYQVMKEKNLEDGIKEVHYVLE